MIKKKKKHYWKQINVLSDIMWLCAGVLVRWYKRLELKATDGKWTNWLTGEFFITQATTPVADPVQYFLTEGEKEKNFISWATTWLSLTINVIQPRSVR